MHGVAANDQVGQVIVQLWGFGDGLHAIRESLGEGVKHLTKKTRRTKTSSCRRCCSASANYGEGWIGISLKEASAQVAQRQAEPPPSAAAAELPEQKVIVRHRVPREVLDVVKSQFEVMNTWLEPLLTASEGQRRDLDKLQNAVQTCLANYDSLLQQLEQASRPQS